MTKILPLGLPNSQPIAIQNVEEHHLSRTLGNSSSLNKGSEKFLQFILAIDPNQGWHRPAHTRLERFESELRSAFINADLDDFVNGTTPSLGYDGWKLGGHDSIATRNGMLIDFIKLKLGVALNEHYLLQDMPEMSFQELLPRLKSALVYQEVNRLVTTELGIPEDRVIPSLGLNPNKGQKTDSVIDISETKRHEFIRKVAESFDINAEQLIKDFESSEWESISCLWDAVLNQTDAKYGTQNPRTKELVANS